MEEKLINLGALEDTRSEEEKKKDWLHEETTNATLVEWKEKSNWKRYPVKRQYYSLECVAQSTTKGLGINNERETGKYEDLSAEFFYYFRINKPYGGMSWPDAMDIAIKLGSCKAERIKQRRRESDPETAPTESMKVEAKTYRGKSYLALKTKSMDAIAQIIESQGYCLLWVYFDVNGEEWWKPVPKIAYPNLTPYEDAATRHAIIVVDYGLKNGVKVLKVEDSAGNDTALNDQDRFFYADFLPRVFQAGYVLDMTFAPDPTPAPIHHVFNVNYAYGDQSEDIKVYQDILKTKGFFPKDQESTGYFGGLTASGNQKYQESKGVSPLARNNLGPKTRAALNLEFK